LQNCSNLLAGEFAGGAWSFCWVSGAAPPVCGAAAPPWAVPGFEGAAVVCVCVGVGVATVVVDVEVDVGVGAVVVGVELSTCGALAWPGTVSVGAVVGSGSAALVVPPPPQAARDGRSAVTATAIATRRKLTSYPSTAGSRRPQVGQSGMSFGASCSSEQPQSRRFSTAQGRLLWLGASGRTFPTTVNSSPVSRST
jgi:hypothetical protein